MDGGLAPPSLDLSEFPSLTNRPLGGPNENGGSTSLSGRPNYGSETIHVYLLHTVIKMVSSVGIIKTPVSESAAEFTMSNEDFPALPGTQNNDSTSTGNATESKVTSTSVTTTVNSNLNSNNGNSNSSSKRGLQISSDGKVCVEVVALTLIILNDPPFFFYRSPIFLTTW